MKPEIIKTVEKIAAIAGITDEIQLNRITIILAEIEHEAWKEGFDRSSEVHSKTMDVVLNGFKP